MSNPTPTGFYESEVVLAEYLLFHYGDESAILPYAFGPKEALHFPTRCVSECLDPTILDPRSRALDLGCAVGRSTFELARHAEEVIGIDHSSSFIAAAQQLRDTGRLPFSSRVEGDLTQPHIAEVPADIDRARTRFQVGDALNLPKTLGSFDIVLAANLIDRLPRPADFLARLPSLINPGGQLILISPYTWLEAFTPRTQWLGGFERDGSPVTTFATLEETLSPHFDLILRKDLPFLIREHARKFQWSVAEATTWHRRA